MPERPLIHWESLARKMGIDRFAKLSRQHATRATKELESMAHRGHRGQKGGPMRVASAEKVAPLGLSGRGLTGATASLEAANG
jgi:hypothetical protein